MRGKKRPTPCVRLGLHKVAAAEEMALFSFFWAAVLIFSCTSFTEIDYAILILFRTKLATPDNLRAE